MLRENEGLKHKLWCNTCFFYFTFHRTKLYNLEMNYFVCSRDSVSNVMTCWGLDDACAFMIREAVVTQRLHCDILSQNVHKHSETIKRTLWHTVTSDKVRLSATDKQEQRKMAVYANFGLVVKLYSNIQMNLEDTKNTL